MTDSTGEATVSNLLVVGANSVPPNVDYTLSVDATNTNPLVAAIVTVAVIAVDNTGADITSTATNISGTVPPGTTTATFLDFGFASVPTAVAAKIQFWRIVSATLP